ncbi:MAG TPA: nitronate monooxygenase [Myxococcota bacterium]|nr:nitronate monooxygenase [Myxococcota bacterium]
MIETRFTKLVGATAPIQVASMPGISTAELVAAAADAGAVGMIGAPLLSADDLESELAWVAKATSGVFGVNFLMPFLDPACVAVAARGARIVEFFYGDPQRALVDEVHAFGALASWQVGSLDEALAAERAGCDFVVAQGTEAGGHVRGQSSLLPFLSEVLDALGVPVLAAGGIATARDLAAVLACGASGARIGTRFAACAESGAHPSYVKALLAATAADTCLTEVFSDLWPNAPHRVLRSAVAAAQRAPDGVAGEIRRGSRAIPIARFSAIAPTATTTGNVEAMALYAGEGVTHVTSVQPAAQIIAELVAGAERLRASR